MFVLLGSIVREEDCLHKSGLGFRKLGMGLLCTLWFSWGQSILVALVCDLWLWVAPRKQEEGGPLRYCALVSSGILVSEETKKKKKNLDPHYNSEQHYP